PVAAYASTNMQHEDLPLRSDCIVEVAFNQSSFTHIQWHTLTMGIGEALRSAVQSHKSLDVADIGSQYHADTNTQRIYIQYFRKCNARIEMTGNLMKYFKSNLPDFPDYKILKNRVQPNARATIDVCGRFWRDCKREELPAPTSSTVREPTGKLL
ncbi:MAG: hypothetical protein ACRETQ_12505, partial [Gammaproteobacteria bacterium]